jgi:hypothetical protein
MADKENAYFSPEGKLTIAAILAAAVTSIFIIIPLFMPLPSDVSGVVIDDDTGRPVPDARVVMPLTELRDTTDSLGIFRIDDLKPKKYYLEVSHNDYQRNGLVFRVPGDGELHVLETIRLSCGSITPWPVPDYVLHDFTQKSLFFNYPCGYSSLRSNLPDNLPVYYLYSVTDFNGGRWVLRPFDRYRDAWIFYINPRGEFVARCPTGLTEQEITSARASGDSLIISCVGFFDRDSTYEVSFGTSDMTTDSDDDGFIDKFEEFYGLDMFDKDTDHDGIDDFNDPLPTIAKPEINNDTLEVLRKCLEMEGFPFTKYEFTGNTLTSVLNALPPEAAGQLYRIAQRRADFFCVPEHGRVGWRIRRVKPGRNFSPYRLPKRIYFEDFADRKSSFELTLADMKPDELRYFFPYLSNLVIAEKINIPYLELLEIADERNIAQIRQRILHSAFKSVIQPRTIGHNLIDYPAHPSITGAMYIPYDRDKYPKKLLYNVPRAPVLNVVKIDDQSAVVQVKEGLNAWDKVFLKKNGEWILIDDYPYRPERETEDRCDRMMKQFLNLDVDDKMRQVFGPFLGE